MRLRTWEEIKGNLQHVSDSPKGVEVTIDGDVVMLEGGVNRNLRQAIGKDVSILYTDSDYFIRVEGDE